MVDIDDCQQVYDPASRSANTIVEVADWRVGRWRCPRTSRGRVIATVAMVALGAGTGQLGVREPTQIACEALKGYRGSKILGCTFYGFQLFEYAALADVVCKAFPAALEGVPADVRALSQP